MQNYEIRITRQARENLKEIRNYITTVLLSPLAAKNTMELIKSKIQSLQTMPGRAPLTPEQPWHDEGIHRMKVNNYYIYFWIDEEHKKVQIIGIIYIRRDQTSQLFLMDPE